MKNVNFYFCRANRVKYGIDFVVFFWGGNISKTFSPASLLKEAKKETAANTSDKIMRDLWTKQMYARSCY